MASKCILVLGVIVFLLKGAIAQDSLYCKEIDSTLSVSKSYFPFGVASGDPQYHSVVLWTCVYPRIEGDVNVDWELSTDTLFRNILLQGTVQAKRDQGYTIKVVPNALQPGLKYFYRFRYKSQYSAIGRTRTAPQSPEKLSFGIVSCSSISWGYYNAYAALARERDLQAVIHLGDYIYEYGAEKYFNPKLNRRPLPKHEIVSLQDYRSRYAHYRLDPDLQEVHRLHPFITVWDDHEIANDAYKDGAQNHQAETEGLWEQRKSTARRVYFEWLPIREHEQYDIRRNFSFGGLASLFMLDGRLEGRTKQLPALTDSSLNDTSRTMLGKQQADWLIESVVHAEAKWKLIGNQVIFSEYKIPPKLGSYSKSTDMWNGYPVERSRILSAFQSDSVDGVIILTGDVHCSFSFDTIGKMQRHHLAQNGLPQV
jgi:alkaline phosphatase D